MEETRNDELMHHGRKGQKWGKKNGPPYPLDYSDLSPEEIKQAKGEAIARGDKDELQKNFNHFTNKEAEQVIERFNINQRINDLNKLDVKNNMKKVEDLASKINTYNDAFEKGSKLYNSAAKICNAFFDKDLPIIGENKQTSRWEKVKRDKDGEIISREVKTKMHGVEREETYDYNRDKKAEDKAKLNKYKDKANELIKYTEGKKAYSDAKKKYDNYKQEQKQEEKERKQQEKERKQEEKDRQIEERFNKAIDKAYRKSRTNVDTNEDIDNIFTFSTNSQSNKNRIMNFISNIAESIADDDMYSKPSNASSYDIDNLNTNLLNSNITMLSDYLNKNR